MKKQRGRTRSACCFDLPIAIAVLALSAVAHAASPDEPPPYQSPPPPETFPVREYRIVGAKILPRDLVDKAVYGHLGPGRTPADV
jgi:hypothetical protein